MTLQSFFTGPETWCQGLYYDLRRRCLVSAAMECYPDVQVRLEIYEKLRETAGDQSLEAWNDDRDRTFADIRKVVEEANV